MVVLVVVLVSRFDEGLYHGTSTSTVVGGAKVEDCVEASSRRYPSKTDEEEEEKDAEEDFEVWRSQEEPPQEDQE